MGTDAFLREWVKMAERLVALATEDVAQSRLFSAGEKLRRAALYYQVAERMQGHGHPGRVETYGKALRCFTSAMEYAREPVQRVAIPFGKSELSALYMRAPGSGRKPVVIYCNGLDSTKELLWLTSLPGALARRGISSLCVDQPGTGEALRFGVVTDQSAEAA